MKKLIHRASRILRDRKGEIVIESIVSLLVFSVLLVTVSAMVQTSLTIIRVSVQSAEALQEQIINPVILSKYIEDGSVSTLTFTYNGGTSSHEVILNDGEILAFSPDER